MKPALVAIVAALMLGCAEQDGNEASETLASAPEAMPEPAAPIFSGSGYADLENSVINYSYERFGGFSLTWADNKVRWDAMHGYYEGLQAEIVPQVSKIAENIYFTSWGTGGNGGDNVVHNFDDMTVHAHLNPRNLWIPMDTIHGVVHCKDTPDCVRPLDKLLPVETPRETLLLENSARHNLPPRRQRSLYITELSEADAAARAELAGIEIGFETPYGYTRIEVEGVETRVSEGEEASVVYPTTATKIADGIYFVSWVGPLGGNHIVINRHSNKVFDHILPSGERIERIYDLACFGAPTEC